MFRTLLALLIATMCATSASASYLVAVPEGAPDRLDEVKKAKRAHIVVAGRASDLGAKAIISVLAQGQRISRLYPGEAVVVYLVDTPDYNEDMGKYLSPITAVGANGKALTPREIATTFGFKTIASNDTLLDAGKLVSELKEFNGIAALHALSHSSIPSGVFLDSVKKENTKSAWQPFDAGIADKGLTASLKGKFTSDAYAIIHGCNGGHLSARWMSEVWGIPVAGNFAYSHFEVDYGAPGEARYMWSNKDVRVPAPRYWPTMRMKTDDVNYSKGYFGTYPHGLPMYKFFCPGIAVEKCQKGMARAALSTVTTVRPPSQKKVEDVRAHYEAVARDYLCPSDIYGKKPEDIKRTIGKSCFRVLEEQTPLIHATGKPAEKYKNYMPFASDTSLQCSANACYDAACYEKSTYLDSKLGSVPVALACAKGMAIKKKDPSELAPARTNKESGGHRYGSTSLMDEYVALVKAFEQIKNDVPPSFMD